jgi:hypothetical protein
MDNEGTMTPTTPRFIDLRRHDELALFGQIPGSLHLQGIVLCGCRNGFYFNALCDSIFQLKVWQGVCFHSLKAPA